MSSSDKGYLRYEEASLLVRAAGIVSAREFEAWTPKPKGMPPRPDYTYANDGWVNWGKFLGNGRGPRYSKFLPYEEASRLARGAGITTQGQYRRWERPAGVPSNPNVEYKQEWRGWGAFLGTDRVAYRDANYVTYEEAQRITRRAGIRNRDEFRRWSARPVEVPLAVEGVYHGNGWKGWVAFLGPSADRRGRRISGLLSYAEAVAAVRRSQIRTRTEFREWARRPEGMPSKPAETYRGKGWINWEAFLGAQPQSPAPQSIPEDDYVQPDAVYD